MNSKIKDLISPLHAQKTRGSVSRIAEGASHVAKEQFSAHAIADLERRYEALKAEIGHTEIADHKVSELPYLGGFKSERLRDLHARDYLVSNLNLHDQNFFFHIPSGDTVICAPYDDDWTIGTGDALGARFDGKVKVYVLGSGFSAAGIGFLLTTNEPILAELTPLGNYTWNYVSMEDLWSSSTAGGLKMIVHDGPNTIAETSANLWSQHGLQKWRSHTGSGQIAHAKSPSLAPFGSLPLCPLRFNMYPGRQYVVSVYGWAASSVEKPGALIGGLHFEMPCVTIHAGPQINPPH